MVGFQKSFEKVRQIPAPTASRFPVFRQCKGWPCRSVPPVPPLQRRLPRGIGRVAGHSRTLLMLFLLTCTTAGAAGVPRRSNWWTSCPRPRILTQPSQNDAGTFRTTTDLIRPRLLRDQKHAGTLEARTHRPVMSASKTAFKSPVREAALSVLRPTCGVKPGQRCQLISEQPRREPRREPHRDRRRIATSFRAGKA
jgi:hypothetical protein